MAGEKRRCVCVYEGVGGGVNDCGFMEVILPHKNKYKIISI